MTCLAELLTRQRCERCDGTGELRGDVGCGIASGKDCPDCYGSGVQVAECVGCGFCCRQAPCHAAQRVYGPVKSCPSLQWDSAAKRYWCGLCRLPGDIGAAYRKELAAGAGCCSTLNTDRDNIPPPVPAELVGSGPALERQVKVLLRYIGNGFISGDALWLAIDSAGRVLGKEWRAEAMSYIREMRHKHVEEFMG